ncbi:MAG: hypothetical protein ISR69_10310 [Gammaproteobacteria bacterium]|nr:hypothetical protein [Gammaproteobacteria bacterium]
MNDKNLNAVHWSFWINAVALLLWNVMGGINFMMQMNPEMLANYPEAARSLVEARPLWATVAFAIAVFAGAIGCLLLLLKKSVAYYVFIASLLGVLVTNIYTFGITSSTEIWVGSLMSLVVATFLIWYSKRAKRLGWIK